MQQATVWRGKTAFGNYTVVDEHYNGRPARVLYSDHRLAAQSGLALDDETELLFDYNERFMELVRGLRPKQILVLGGGACTLPAAMLASVPDIQIDVVEIDVELVEVAKAHFGFKPDARCRIFIEDALAFLQRTTDDYDLILVDIFHGERLPEAFQTTEFAQLLRSHLRTAGCVALNTITALNGLRSALLHRQLAALHAHFPQVTVYPASHGLSAWTPQNLVIVAVVIPRNLNAYLRYVPYITALE